MGIRRPLSNTEHDSPPLKRQRISNPSPNPLENITQERFVHRNTLVRCRGRTGRSEVPSVSAVRRDDDVVMLPPTSKHDEAARLLLLLSGRQSSPNTSSDERHESRETRRQFEFGSAFETTYPTLIRYEPPSSSPSTTPAVNANLPQLLGGLVPGSPTVGMSGRTPCDGSVWHGGENKNEVATIALVNPHFDKSHVRELGAEQISKSNDRYHPCPSRRSCCLPRSAYCFVQLKGGKREGPVPNVGARGQSAMHKHTTHNAREKRTRTEQ